MVNFWKNKKVLITGNTGFKGCWLSLWLLKKGALICGCSLEDNQDNHLFTKLKPAFEKVYPEQFNNISVDINCKKDLGKIVNLFQPDIVFHLAAQSLVLESYKKPMETFQTNIIGSLNLLESLKNIKKKCAILVVTTDKVYEDKDNIYGYREIDPLGGYDPYSASKAALEICVKSWRDSFCKEENSNLLISTARAGNVVGGGDWSKHRIVPDIINTIKNNISLELRNPDHIRPWQHVLEPLSGYIKLVEFMFSCENNNRNSLNSAFNFGPELCTNKSVKYLVEEFTKYFEIRYFFRENEENFHESKILTLSSEKAKSLLNWSSLWSFEETIERTALWYKDFLNGIDSYECCLRDINAYESQNKDYY